MGGPMAANLVRAGFEVAAYDVDPGRVTPPLQRCASVAEVCERTSGLVVSIVRTLDQTAAVLSEADTVAKVIDEVAATRITERGATRGDDKVSEAAMEDRKREGYF